MVATPVRRPLVDITNVRPLDFGSPIKRTRSEPLPAAATIPPFSPQSPLSHSDVLRSSHSLLIQPTKVVALKLDTTQRTVRRWKRKFEEQQTLDDEQRSGRPMELDEETMVNIAVTARSSSHRE